MADSRINAAILAVYDAVVPPLNAGVNRVLDAVQGPDPTPALTIDEEAYATAVGAVLDANENAIQTLIAVGRDPSSDALSLECKAWMILAREQLIRARMQVYTNCIIEKG